MIILKYIFKLLPHASIILSLMFTTFAIIDMQNKAMGFLDNNASRVLIIIWSVISFVTEGLLIYYQRKQAAEEAAKAAAARRAALLDEVQSLSELAKQGVLADDDMHKALEAMEALTAVVREKHTNSNQKG